MSTFNIDPSIKEAVELWVDHGLNPGSCTELLLRGDYDRAFKYAHPHIKPFWNDYVEYIKTIPIECRNENYDSWKTNKITKEAP